MAKPIVVEQRYDFRGGRNTAISTDLLNPNELVDATNTRLSVNYGGFTKRTGSQRIHQTSFGNRIDGLTQWDGPNGKQTVVISSGKLWYRNGFDYGTAFTSVAPTVPGTPRSTNNGTDGAKAWNGGSTSNSISRTTPGVSTVVAGSRIFCKLGDPNQTEGSNIPSADNTYILSGFSVTINTTGITGSGGYFIATVTWEYSTDSGGSWTAVSNPSSNVSTGLAGQVLTTNFGAITFTVPGAPAHVWIRMVLSVGAQYTGWSGTVTASASVNLSGTIQTFSWTTGAGSAQLGGPVTFAPFRAATAGAPLKLFFAANNHYWSWDGTATLTLLDPTNSAPAAYTIAAYHTRMFATTQTQPKNLFWSKIGDATNFTTGTKTDGGSALTDFLTGNALIAMEEIGSSLLLATTEAIMRFTGHASDDIVIAQDTEGVSTEVGVIGPLAIKRFENVAAFMTNRGPYVATETYVQPIGEQLNPDWYALDQASLPNCIIEYHRGRKELWIAVPRSGDGGLNKTLFVQSSRLQAWQGPWTYSFDITAMSKYVDISGAPNIIVGSTDGFVRIMDVQNPNTTTVLDDVLYDGSGGSAITMQVELPVLHFGIPGLAKAVDHIKLQAKLPLGSMLTVKTTMDQNPIDTTIIQPVDTFERDFKVDVFGVGFRTKVQFIDSSTEQPSVFGMTFVAYNYLRDS